MGGLSTTRRMLRRGGPAKALRHAASRLFEAVYLKRELIEFKGDMHTERWFIEGRDPVAHKADIDVEIRKAGPGDLEKFARLVPLRRLRRFREWFERGYEAFIALKDGEIVYYQWLAFGDYHHPWVSMDFRIGEDEVYPIDVYAVPKYRMKNIHMAVDSMLFRYCRDMGRYRLVATASPEKFELFRLMYRRGGLCTVHPSRSITYKRLLGLKRHRIKDLGPAGRGEPTGGMDV